MSQGVWAIIQLGVLWWIFTSIDWKSSKDRGIETFLIVSGGIAWYVYHFGNHSNAIPY